MQQETHERWGKVAYILYRGGAVDNPDLVDDRSSGDPLPVMLGAHKVPKGVEEALFDMEVGTETTLDIPSELGYGRYIESEAQWYPRALLANGYQMKVGDFFPFTDPQNELKRIVHVTEATQDAVKIDFNHPFAGKDLRYWVKLVDLK